MSERERERGAHPANGVESVSQRQAGDDDDVRDGDGDGARDARQAVHERAAAGDARGVDEVEALGEVLPQVDVRRVARFDAQVLQRLRATTLQL